MRDRLWAFPLAGLIAVIAYTRVGANTRPGNHQQFFSPKNKLLQALQCLVKRAKILGMHQNPVCHESSAQ
jgi:hypothetical protein